MSIPRYSPEFKEEAIKQVTELGLPARLVENIRDGTLLAKIDLAYQEYDRWVALLDTWEAENPAAARLTPWAAGREAW